MHSLPNLSKPTTWGEQAPRWLRACARLAQSSRATPIIAITGSVGKTTTKEWVADVLESTHDVIRTPGNRNLPRGIASTLLGVPFGPSIRSRARRAMMLAPRIFLWPPRPDYFVLEVATVRSGNIPTSLSMFTPTIAVVTSVSEAHLDGFGSMAALIVEKSRVVSALLREGSAVLCYDDPHVRAMGELHAGRTLYFGFSPRAEIRMEEPNETRGGLSTILHDPDGPVSLYFPYLVNKSLLYAAMVAWCVGRLTGVPPDRMTTILESLSPVRGRGRILEGPRQTIIMDETWNANPASMRSAMETFHVVSRGRRKIMILGDMLELGEEAERLHRQVGREAAQYADILIGVGESAGWFVEEFQRLRPSSTAFHCRAVDQAMEYVETRIQEGDALMLKASHGIHLDAMLSKLQNLDE